MNTIHPKKSFRDITEKDAEKESHHTKDLSELPDEPTAQTGTHTQESAKTPFAEDHQPMFNFHSGSHASEARGDVQHTGFCCQGSSELTAVVPEFRVLRILQSELPGLENKRQGNSV